MIRFCDGFDQATAAPNSNDQVAEKYVHTYSLEQVGKGGGRDGSGESFALINTAFGYTSFQKVFDQQGTWGWHIDLLFDRDLRGDFALFTLGNATDTLLSVRMLGTRDVQLLNHSGTVIAATSGGVWTPGQWFTMQVQAVYGGRATLRIDGATVAEGGFTGGPGTRPDRLAFRYEIFGPPTLYLDNYVIWDGQAGGPTSFLGRVRVTTLFPVADEAPVWTPSAGPHCWPMVNDSTANRGLAPDDDATTIQPAVPSDSQLFQFQTAPCFGHVHLVALNVAARSAGSPISIDLRYQGAHAESSIGYRSWSGGAYSVQQALAPTNPDTGAGWVAAEITAGSFGVRAVAARVSAVYLEQVVDLTGIPFTCGGASYSF